MTLLTTLKARITRLFVITSKFEAFLLIYALGTGAVERGISYLHRFPGTPGWIMFAACTGAVFIAGGMLLDAVEQRLPE